MGTVILAAVFLLSPALVMYLCRKIRVLEKIGPIFILYILGAFLGNAGIPHESLSPIQNSISSITVPLAIPLLLFSCRPDFRKSGKSLAAILSGFVSVIAAIVIAYLLLGDRMSSPQTADMGARIGAMMSGTYTGGTVNMASIQKMLSVPEEVFVIANALDMGVSFLYLVILMGFGIKVLRKVLPRKEESIEESITKETGIRKKDTAPNEGKSKIMGGIISTAIAAAIVGVSYMIATSIDGLSTADVFMTVFILLITTLSIAASFVPRIQSLNGSSDVGMYLIYIFSITVASMADFRSMTISGGTNILLFLLIAVFGSLIIHVLLSKLLRIDADTMIITSVSLINSPPFVPVVAGAMKNSQAMITGLTSGIIGYAVGNYLGLGIFTLLSSL